MKVILKKSSVVTLEAMSDMALGELNYYVFAIKAATDLKNLQALMLDDVTIIDENHFTMAIKGNYQHVTTGLVAEIDNNLEVTITLLSYD
jgi:hypothetical protein